MQITASYQLKQTVEIICVVLTLISLDADIQYNISAACKSPMIVMVCAVSLSSQLNHCDIADWRNRRSLAAFTLRAARVYSVTDLTVVASRRSDG